MIHPDAPLRHETRARLSRRLTSVGVAFCVAACASQSRGPVGEPETHRTVPVSPAPARQESSAPPPSSPSPPPGQLAGLDAQVPTLSATAVPIAALAGALDLAMNDDGGPAFGCAVLRDRTVACWGAAPLGAGESPRASGRLTRVPGIDDAIDLALGTDLACARRRDGSVRCWGEPFALRNMGIAANISETIEPLRGADQIVIDGRYVCWLRGGVANCAGTFRNDDMSNTPVALHDLAGVRRLVGNATRVCAVMLDGTVRCVGDRFAVGGDFGSRPTFSAATPIPYTHGVVDGVFNGMTFLVTLDASGVAWTIDRGSHSAPHRGVRDVVSLSSRRFGPICAARRDGSVACWGWNEGADVDFVWPFVVLEGLSDVVRVVRGGRDVCALRRDATVWCRNLDGTPWSAR